MAPFSRLVFSIPARIEERGDAFQFRQAFLRRGDVVADQQSLGFQDQAAGGRADEPVVLSRIAVALPVPDAFLMNFAVGLLAHPAARPPEIAEAERRSAVHHDKRRVAQATVRSLEAIDVLALAVTHQPEPQPLRMLQPRRIRLPEKRHQRVRRSE